MRTKFFRQPHNQPPLTRPQDSLRPISCQSPVLVTKAIGLISLTNPKSCKRLGWNNLSENAIAAGNRAIPKRKPRRKCLVTFIAGIICQDGIVLAADSQTTYGVPGALRSLDVSKINVIRFKNNREALVAESGFVSLSEIIIDRIKAKPACVEVTNDETIINT